MNERAIGADSGSAPRSRHWIIEWAPQLMVVLGAAIAFASFGNEFLKEHAYFSAKQIAVIAGGCLIMISGSAWQVLLRQRSAVDFARFWTIGGFIALLASAFWVYNIESRAFYAFIGPLTVLGFITNHHLPARARQPFFVLLAALTLAIVFGVANPPAALALVATSVLLIGVCHLPLPMWARLCILLAFGALLAALRLGWVQQHWISAALPVLASIFMFRLAVYLYDIANGKGPKDFWGRVAYFFMFPNFVIPFFPLVDFTVAGRTYYNDDALKIYARGAIYIFRGLIHLLLYRFIYFHAVLAPDDVRDAASFLQYIVANFGLYFRISGLFHLIVGILLLFGYNLPETHGRFYFSNSFTDFWRRINIYWKDFMQKMVFTPSYMQLKKLRLSHNVGVALSIAAVFTATWLLHSYYQWFWLSGTFLNSLPDLLFWAVLAICLIVQTSLEARPRKRQTQGGLLGPRAFLVLRTVCTMFVICLIWSFWTLETWSEWLVVLARSGLAPAFRATPHSIGDWATTLIFFTVIGFMVAVACGISFGLPKPAVSPRSPTPKRGATATQFPYRAMAACAAGLATLIVARTPLASDHLPETAHAFLQSLTSNALNRVDSEQATRSYYENLAGRNQGRSNPEFWDMINPNDHVFDSREFGIEYRSDYLWRSFTPNSVAKFREMPGTYSINRWGFADIDYDLAKPAGAHRIVLIGASRSMGLGLSYEARFETLLEQRLNQDQHFGRHEILNFGFTSYSPVQRLMLLEQRAIRFDPDVVIYEAGLIDTWWDQHTRMILHGAPMPLPSLDDINRRAGVDWRMNPAEISRRLEPYTDEMLEDVYRRIVAVTVSRGATPIWLHIPDPADHPGDAARLEHLAREAGFITVRLDPDFDAGRYQQTRTDTHPNEEGNQIIADLIYARLMQLQEHGQVNLRLPTAEPARNVQ